MKAWISIVLLALLAVACTGDDASDSASGECVVDDDEIDYTVAYEVVDGELGDLCLGSANDALETSWDILTDFTPPAQLTDLAVFAGFDNPESDTYAFVTVVDDVGERFEMTVNLDEAEKESDELLITLAHEFAHVFTTNFSQVDRGVFGDDCDTYDGGEGCYYDDAIMTEWVELFWQDHIDDFDPGDNDEGDAEDRCDLDGGFFGTYGATNPEEDFAESFGAYVMRVPAETTAQQDRLDWIDRQIGLREFRDRAADAGYGPLPSNFDPCGQG